MGAELQRIVRAAEAAAQAFRHPLNPDSEVSGAQLAPRAGLCRLGVSIARVPAGEESFICHRRHAEEEWVYILEGEGESDIDDVVERVGYPAGVAHTLRNVGGGDLVDLMGGEQLAVEIADFPRHARRLLRAGACAEVVEEAALARLAPKRER